MTEGKVGGMKLEKLPFVGAADSQSEDGMRDAGCGMEERRCGIRDAGFGMRDGERDAGGAEGRLGYGRERFTRRDGWFRDC